MLVDVGVIVVCVALAALGIVWVVRWGAREPEPGAGLLRRVALTLVVGTVSGVLAAGAGGRVVMRLLAVTSPDAEGQVTEAGETIGEISIGGTAGFLVFSGVGAGLLTVMLFMLVGSLLPRGWAGGATLGLLALVLAGARLEPLREDNFDFNLVGPGWLALLAFTALAVFQGMLTWALAARLKLPPLALGRHVTAGRVVTGLIACAALPGFAAAVAGIL